MGKMVLSKINGFNVALVILVLLFVVEISAETTFFDHDDFIIWNSTAGGEAGGVIGGSTGGATDGGACTDKWDCTNWSECLSSGKQTRNCTNIGTCSDTYTTPKIEQNCTYTTPKKVVEEDKELGNGTEKQNESEKLKKNEIVDDNKLFFYFITILIIGFVVLYLKKGYFKKLRKKVG